MRVAAIVVGIVGFSRPRFVRDHLTGIDVLRSLLDGEQRFVITGSRISALSRANSIMVPRVSNE